MPRQKGTTQLELLRRRHAEIADQLKAAEAKERERDRQLENRRKELLGIIVADYLKSAPDTPFKTTLLQLVNQKLTKPADRALFSNLPEGVAAGERATKPPAKAGHEVGNG